MEAIESDECFATLEDLRAEGKIRHYGVALGPAIGWREEGLRAIATRGIASVQTVYNLLEQDPGRDLHRRRGRAWRRASWPGSRRRRACSTTT